MPGPDKICTAELIILAGPGEADLAAAGLHVLRDGAARLRSQSDPTRTNRLPSRREKSSACCGLVATGIVLL